MKSRHHSKTKQCDVPIIACNIQYWTLNENQCQIPDDTLSAHSYHDKDVKKQDSGSHSLRHGQFYYIKQNYIMSRGGACLLPNKRPDHLRDSVKELEEILKSHTVLYIKWTKRNRLQVVLHTGMILNILMSEAYDIQKLVIDKSVMNKLPSESGPISSAILTDRFCLLSFTEQNKLGFMSYTQRPGTPEHKLITSKISSMDMKVSFHDIPGAPNRRCERKLCVNKVDDLAICWCSSYKGPTTWTPTFSDKEKANLILLGCSFGRMEVRSYVETECDPVSVEFSRLNPYHVHTLEKSVNTRNESQLHFNVYECTQSKIQRLSMDSIPLKSGVLSSQRNRDEDKIVIGCTDGTVMLYNVFSKSVTTVRTSSVPSIVSWHPNDGVVMVASGNAELRSYDSALSPLSTALIGDVFTDKKKDFLKLSQFLSAGNGLVSLKWLNPVGTESKRQDEQIQHQCHDAALLLFDGGPLAILKLKLGVTARGLLRPYELVKEYLSCKNVSPAVEVLHSINWNIDRSQGYLALITIVNHLLKLPLNQERENQLESSFTAFYAPKCPLAEKIVVDYRHAMSRYARRFCHHLISFKRFEKAFLLAKDIRDADLFVDIYFAAKEVGQVSISKAAKLKALELQSPSTSADEDSYSGTDSEEESSGEEEGGEAYPYSQRHGPGQIRTHPKAHRIAKQIPPEYPPPKMNDFMSALMNEAHAVVDEGPTKPRRTEEDLSDVGASSSTLKVMHFGYV